MIEKYSLESLMLLSDDEINELYLKVSAIMDARQRAKRHQRGVATGEFHPHRRN